MTNHARCAWNFIRTRPWQAAGVAITILLMCELSAMAVLAVHNSNVAEKQAEANAQKLADLQRSPFKSVTLDSIKVANGPALPPDARAIFAHPCDAIPLHRTAIVTEPMQVLISKALINSGTPSIRLPAGSELFHVGANAMTPVFQVPSNAKRGVFWYYDTVLSDISRYAPPYQMQGFNLCIIDVGLPLPVHGPCPPPPAQPPVAQPNCPVFTTSSPALAP